ncbi:MAG: type IV secretion system DNA-binding domain-containing protein [Candidatus Pacebacteria bacterium]|nr:type IV secretion system DNA-binding domain-containing protein [Candidatus Paceibacterota bacterium]
MALPIDKQILILGETNFRNEKQRFGIKSDDRRRHMYVVGSTGMGKSEFLKNMAIQDIEEGRGLAFLDPHGDGAQALINFVPKHRIKDVIYFDPADLAFPIAFNVLEKVEYEYRHLIASGLLGVFKKLWGAEAWSGRMEYILNNTILALLEYPDSTLLGINRLMSSKEYRKKIVDNLKDPIVKAFWTEEFAKYSDKFASEATAAIQNKVGQFSSNNVIRNIIGQVGSKLDIRKIMDEGKILIVNLSKGAIGEDASRLIGALLITKIQLAAMSRVDTPEVDRRDFYLYVDEFQNFATESFANILSEARKYHLNLVVAHQYITQMEEEVRDAVFGNVGTLVTFRVGAEDAEFLEKWYSPDFMAPDIVNLGKREMYIKLMVNGITSKGFSARTSDSLKAMEESHQEEVVAYSRENYATTRDEVEKNVAQWATPMEPVNAPRMEGGYRTSNQGPARQPYQGSRPRDNNGPSRPRPQSFQTPRPPAPNYVPQPAPTKPVVSLDTLKAGDAIVSAVDFRNQKNKVSLGDQNDSREPKKQIDTVELKKILEEALRSN